MKVRFSDCVTKSAGGDFASFPFTHLFRRLPMLFTEENLKNFRMTKNGNFNCLSYRQIYHYHYACNECGYPYLNQRKNGKYCSIKCTSHGVNNACFGRTGELNYNYTNGDCCNDICPYCVTWRGKYNREWKEYPKYTRDQGKCWSPYCNGKHIDKLTLHHINYNKKECDGDNLITLCCSCNTKANKDREWHETYYSLLMVKRRI